jgi:hypothetical protein
MSNAQVYQIEHYQASAVAGTASGTIVGQSSGTLKATYRELPHGGSESPQPIEPHQLYPFSDPDDSAILQALAQLGTCVSALQRAQRIDPNIDYLSFDEELIRARASLRGLFALRSIGDGFAAVINASLWSLKNREADVLNKRQLLVLQNCLNTLKQRPILHFDSAAMLLEEMEAANLAIEPDRMDELLGLSDSPKDDKDE